MLTILASLAQQEKKRIYAAKYPCQIFVNVVSVEVDFIVLQGIRQKNTVFGYVASDYIVRTHVNVR